jgi:hypothetical protein
VLIEDGVVAGLDKRGGSADVYIGPLHVATCVGVELSAPTPLASVVARVSAVGDACGTYPCVTGPNGCGTGHTFGLLAGVTRETIMPLGGEQTLPTSLQEVSFPVGGQTIGAIVVCRLSWGEGRDDVAVDVIAGVCP